jgi:hypothetical protein
MTLAARSVLPEEHAPPSRLRLRCLYSLRMGEINDAANVAKTTVSAVAQVIDIAKSNQDAREAGANLAKTAKVLTEFIGNLALPRAAGNFVIQRSADYFRKKFGERLAEKLADVDPEDLQPPKPVIAGPAIEGLNYAHDEPELEDMFTSLIASSMNAKTTIDAHPAFVDVIRQLDPAEAMTLKVVLRGGFNNRFRPIVELRSGSSGYDVLERNLLHFTHKVTGEQVFPPSTSVWVDNWERLGLVSLERSRKMVDPRAYTWVESNPRFLLHKASHPDLTYGPGILVVTDFGRRFASAIKLVAPPADEQSLAVEMPTDAEPLP